MNNASLPHPTVDRRRREHDRKRELFLQAASQVFGQKGFRASSMEEIARAAEYATGALYRYFPSKDALYVGLLEKRLEERNAYVMEQEKGMSDPAERLHAALKVQAQFALQDMSLLQIYFLEHPETRRGDGWQRVEQLDGNFQEWLAGIIAEGQKHQAFHHGDPMMYVMVLQGMLFSLYRNWASTPANNANHAAEVPFVLQLAMRAITIQPNS